MKKIILASAITLGMSVSAVAAVSGQVVKRSVAPTLPTSEIVEGRVQANEFVRQGVRKDVAREDQTIDDFVGIYKWSSQSSLQGEAWPSAGFLFIEKNPDVTNGMLISGFTPYWTLNATYDPEKKRLYVPNQLLEKDVEEENGENVDYETWFWNYSAYNEVDNEGKPNYHIFKNDKTSFYFSLTETGTLQSGDVDQDIWSAHEYTDEELLDVFCIAAAGDIINGAQAPGYYLLNYWITGNKMEEFVYNDAEWDNIGTAQFKDAWFPVLWEGGQTPPAYDVPLYVNKARPTMFLLYDPYGPETPYKEIEQDDNGEDMLPRNVGTEPGYIIFDISSAKCVVVQPLVYAITVAWVSDGEESYEPLYVYNLEGQYYFTTGDSFDDIINFMDSEGYRTSSLSRLLRTITLRNPVYALAKSPTNSSWWTENPGEFTGSIVLPEGYDAAVEVVIDGSEEAPVYYNLQGVRLLNPEKGQIVIVKKGDKTSKQVYR